MQNIELKKLKPLPLIENGINQGSDIYGTEGGVFFEKGKKYWVTAPSGKGKSTFLHAIYGLRQDFEGDILLDNKSVKGIERETWASIRQKNISLVFQDLRLFPNLTASENIHLKRDLTGTPALSELDKWIDLLEVRPFLHQKTATLSYGQRQRVAILRGVSQPFDFLLLDEPFSHLDTENQNRATEVIEAARAKQNAAIILVSLGEKYFWQYDKDLRI